MQCEAILMQQNHMYLREHFAFTPTLTTSAILRSITCMRLQCIEYGNLALFEYEHVLAESLIYIISV